MVDHVDLVIDVWASEAGRIRNQGLVDLTAFKKKKPNFYHRKNRFHNVVTHQNKNISKRSHPELYLTDSIVSVDFDR